MVDNLEDREYWKALALPQQVDLICRLKIAHDALSDNFESRILQLLHKADLINGAKLRQVYPELTAVVNAWQNSTINPNYTVPRK
jgi:hypothetical protein